MSRKAVVLILVSAIAIAVAVYHRQLAAMVRIWQPALFGCEAIAESVFVQTSLSPGQRRHLLSDLAISRKRLASLFGGPEASPKVIACADESCFHRFGGVSAKGNAYGRYAIVLSPRGLSAVFLTHELFHAELAQRIGITKLWLTSDIPRWFDEGLAVYVSRDPRHNRRTWCAGTDDGKDAPGLDALAGRGDWLAVSRRGGVYSYGTAREEVSHWIERAGAGALERLIERIKAGETFFAAYTSLAGATDTFLPRGGSQRASRYCRTSEKAGRE